MLRRKFIQNIAWLTGGVIGSGFVPAKAIFKSGQKVKGHVVSNGKGLKDVVVSDGYTVMQTDKSGAYEFEPHPDAVALFISTPSGYEFIHTDNVARQYRLLKEASEGKTDFELTRLKKDDNEHRFIIWADPQVKNAKDVEKMMAQSVPSTVKTIAANGEALWHGICVGDIVWDELALFADYDKAVSKMGIPFFQCLGNHDMDYRKGGDETSDDTFQQTYGPTYYSFNRGQVHYAVMDNVRYLGKEREYDGWLQQHQLDWLQKDLAFVPKDKLLVLCMHIPVHSGTKNKEDLYKILGDRNVHIMSGHTHYHVNAIKDKIFEHNHGTVCGAWWTGTICEDGTPNGYGVYTVKDTGLSWHYQATGMPAEHQMKIHTSDFDGAQKGVVVNIWNHDPEWKTEYFVDGKSGGSLEQFEGFDPEAYKNLVGPELPKPRGFAEPKNTKHLFKATVPSSAKEIRIVATDRFGKQFTSAHTLTA